MSNQDKSQDRGNLIVGLVFAAIIIIGLIANYFTK